MFRRVGIVIVFITLVNVLLFSGTASATTIFDDTYNTTSSVKVGVHGAYNVNLSDVDITNTWRDYILDTSKWYSPTANGDANTSLQAAFDHGRWGVSQATYYQGGSSHYGEVYMVNVFWTEDDSLGFEWYDTGYGYRALITTGNDVHTIAIGSRGYIYGGAENPIAWSYNDSGAVEISNNDTSSCHSTSGGFCAANLFVYSDNITYPGSVSPDNYEGTLVTDDWDSDGDLLVGSKERAQGTSDGVRDSDGDGLSDYVESEWYPDHDDTFCDNLAVPKYCAEPNPTQKDIYVQIDWMDDGTIEYKPTSTQIGLVEDMFEDEGIKLHIDTGQFGGGNKLVTYTSSLRYTPTSGQIDFWDYMSGGDGMPQNLDGSRGLIWHYMISGHHGYEKPNSSGWATSMGRALFISDGLINAMSGLADLDRAIANSIAHELGHNLCITDEKLYEEQPDECVYSGADNDNNTSDYYNLENYKSVMNYRYQLTDDDDMETVDYSDGSHGTGDHDDWSAVMLGMSGFAGSHTELGAMANQVATNKNTNSSDIEVARTMAPDGTVIIDDSPEEQRSIDQNQNKSEEIDDNRAAAENATTTTSNSDKNFVKDTGETENDRQKEELPYLAGGAIILLVLLFMAGAALYLKRRR